MTTAPRPTVLGLASGALLLLTTLPSAATERGCARRIDVSPDRPNAMLRQDPDAALWARLRPPPGDSKVGWVRSLQPMGAAILVGADRGLFRLEGDRLRPLADAVDAGLIRSVKLVGGQILVLTDRGLYRPEGSGLTRLPALRRPLTFAPKIGLIRLVKEVSGSILVGADGGLFRLESDRLKPLANGVEVGAIHVIQQVDGAILIGAEQGLFRLEGDQLKPLSADTRVTKVQSVQKIGGGILVSAAQGLLRLEGNRLRLLATDTKLGSVGELRQVGDTILVAAARGLFRLEDDRLKPLAADLDLDRVQLLTQSEGLVLVGAEQGLFRLEGNQLRLLAADTEVGRVRSVSQVSGRVFLLTERGLFRLGNDQLKPLAADTDVGKIRSVQPVSGGLLIGADRGLFRIEGDWLQPVPSDPPISMVNLLHRIGDQPWIGAAEGLYRYAKETFHAQGPKAALTFGTGTTAAIRFSTSPCLGHISTSQLGLIPDAPALSVSASPASPIPADFAVTGLSQRIVTATIGSVPPGTWRVRLAVRAGDGWEPVSEPVELRVAWTPANYAAHYLRQAAPWLAGAHTGLFLLLLAGARRSPWCWRVLGDPVWGRAGLWWHAALRHVPALQRWVLARWFDAVHRRETRPYLPVPLAAPDGAVLAADALLDRLRTQRRLWVQGGAGMGKTALVDDLARQFFTDHASLRAAYRRYGVVPLVVRLRDVLDVKADPAHPDRWVPELARLALRATGLRVDDPTLFRAILESGSFALILDGANETANAAALEDYARTTPEVRLLVTSQADPAKPGFEVLRLPGSVEEMVGPLLALFLGPERGAAVLAAVRPTPLWAGLASGYDVRLLADLAGRDGPIPALPADRVGLYRALLARLRHAGGPYPEAELSRAAWALWRDGVRRFDGTKYLTPDLIEPLRHDAARVVRTIGGILHEYRHDQMRAYLAALWAARHEVAPVRLFETDKAIWRLGFSEQAVVWEFFAALVDRARGEALWQWCHEDPERAVLLHALDQRGRTEGWRLVRNAAEPMVPLPAG